MNRYMALFLTKNEIASCEASKQVTTKLFSYSLKALRMGLHSLGQLRPFGLLRHIDPT